MFANAYEIARKFTMPVIISLRYYSGKVNCSCGAFIVLNDEGWILTTAHIFNSYLQYGQHKKQMQKYEEEKRDGRRHGKYGEEIQAVLVKKKEEDD